MQSNAADPILIEAQKRLSAFKSVLVLATVDSTQDRRDQAHKAYRRFCELVESYPARWGISPITEEARLKWEQRGWE